ncbi:MAG TPA: ABC transporter permease, partial [Mycobacteriales bacterium]|nr:ABC transporter permease [Mycobacteriales bacterium]
VSRLLRVPNVTPGDIDRLSHAAERLTASPALLNSQTVVITSIPSTMSGIHASWGKLAVPVVVVTAELLVLTWLLLFLVVTDAVEARGTEIALAKLRGYGAVRAMVFGLGEPAALLAVSLPVGTLVGWALTAVLSHVLLRDGTPVPLPGLGWAAALVAVLGGVAAVVAAGRRTVVRPVVEQWRRTGRRATHRGWVFDAVVLTAAVAGLVQLYATGTFRSASSSALAMLVPGLLGLAIAVVASRLLPAACRALFRRTRTGGELGSFLAVRHIARRPGGTRTTMILATALALATFSLSAWMVGESNRTRLAQVGVGAPTVLTVAPDPGVDLAKVVDRIDPQGKTAAAVVSYDNGQATLFGVQPRRFARVAHWSAGEVQDPQRLLGGLHPPASDPIILDGDRVRLHFTDVHLSTGPAAAVIELSATGALAPTPVEMGTLHSGGPQTLSGDLSACPCYLSDLQIGPIGGGRTVTAGRVTLTGIDVQRSGTWQRVPRIGGPQQWGDTVDQRVHVQGNGDSVTWRFFAPAINAATLRVLDRPDPLPAVVSAALDRPNSEIPVSGLDAGDLHVTPVADVLGVPGAPSDGVVVDLDYAVRAAAGATAPATQQVWVRGDAGRISDALRKAGIPLLGAVSSHTEVERISRQGPGLASVLFLADAAAAAVLAALAAILSLSAAARRRRYEYAALSAAGASRRTLYAALAIEQVAVIGFGAVTGIGAGLLATAVAGRNVPEFVNPLHSPLLRYLPSPVLMSVVLGAGLVLLVAIAAVAAAALLRSVTPDQLREAPT